MFIKVTVDSIFQVNKFSEEEILLQTEIQNKVEFYIIEDIAKAKI